MIELFATFTVSARAKRLLVTHGRNVDWLLAALHRAADRHALAIASHQGAVTISVWLTDPPSLDAALCVTANTEATGFETTIETREESDRRMFALCERLTSHPDVAERVLGWSPQRLKEEIANRRGYLACSY